MSKSPNVLANNSKSLTSILGGPANNVNAKSASSAIANAAANVTESVRATATNSMNSIANSIKSINNSIAVPLKESINSIPEGAPSLGVILPLILSLGALIIALTLIYVYRELIENKLYSAYSSVKNFVANMRGSHPAPPAENPLEFPIQEQGEPNPSTDIINKLLPGTKQVFNVAANKYTYNDAEPLCKALGAELATYDQVKQAWDEGADWCNYGWVKGQAAVYPTQQSTFDELQAGSSDDERLACGQPGVNGGYFDNPELHFGVNCYGDKPAESSNSLRVTNENAQPPLTPDALNQKKKELQFRAHADTIGLLPFRAHTWSE
jgi:Extracellular link domain